MAQLTLLYKDNFHKPAGAIIHDMLMPDGSKMAYKAMGANAVATIINRFKKDKRRMLNQMLWREVTSCSL